ncbi:hypothetical protein ACJMK2_042870 [Sinanodonta woodiana]|uniref:Kyphoscoliosis peptidase n=1 Tax=Sinanodonta woodiana TaxID=1069815 RepID=A0ABD3VVV3_SINWO
MGSSQSVIIVTENETEEENMSDFLQEATIEQITVPEEEPGYPKACPPLDTKEDIFNKADYLEIDNRAKNTPKDMAKGYDVLIQYLTQGLQNDLQKLRAIFIWLGQQNIEGEKYPKATSADTPIGYMKLIKDRKGNYASFFALLCRTAKIPCVIVKGKAKSVSYEVGMTEEECQRLDNSWNAVYVSGGWRLVFPLWAYRVVVGHVKEGFVKIEAGGIAVRKREKAAVGTDVSQLNEYYFLTSPKDFIFRCFPNEEKWQLQETPWTIQKFADVPYCRQTYFENMVSITSSFKCRLQTVSGECTVAVKGKRDDVFDYELFYNEKESMKPISDELQLQRYILKKHEKSNVEFTLRCPQMGVYTLTIVFGNNKFCLCSFKITCHDPKVDCQPLPVSPEIGFGPSYLMEKMGVKAQSHKTAVVRIQACKETTMTFTCMINVSVETILVHNSLDQEELKRVLKQKVEKNKLTVSIRIIHKGEYALRMFAKTKDSSQEHQNICNYLLTSETEQKRTRTYENAKEKIARNKLNALAKTQRDIIGLQRAIKTFQDLELEDKGDLSKAIDALDHGKAKKDLKDAINRKRLDFLERAIEQAKDSKFSDKLQVDISEAEQQRDELKRLKSYTHDVLEMKPQTISEIKRYQQPSKVVHDVMIATYMLLGEKRKELENWETIRYLLGLTGRDSLLRRVKDFDPKKVDLAIYADVEDLLRNYTENDVRTASSGAGTFYVWLIKVSGEMITMSSSA